MSLSTHKTCPILIFRNGARFIALDTVARVRDFDRLNRRQFVVGSAAFGLLAACGSNGPDPTKPLRLGARFADGFRAPSTAVVGTEQRFPFVVVAEDGLPMITGAPESIDIVVRKGGEDMFTQTVPVRGAGSFTPYYPLEFVPETTGSYVAHTDFADIDFEFLVIDRADTTVFQVGEQLPAFDTPTFDDPHGVSEICTRTETCPFHELTLTEALDNDKPTVVMIATPAFCQTDVCGPSLEFLIDAAAERDDLNVIHVEVYKDFATDVNESNGIPEVSPLLAEWAFDFEPSMFVTDADGTIVRALHFAFDRDEVADAVALV